MLFSERKKRGCEAFSFSKLGALLLQRRGGAKHSPHMRSPEINKKLSKFNDLENEPGHVWRLLKA